MKRILPMIAVTMIATASIAHAPVASRTLRLQLQDGRLSGLLVYHLPALAARPFAAARDPAVALVPRALAGLRFEADGASAAPKVREAKVRAAPDGALDEVLLIDAGPLAHALRVFVEAEPPLPIQLLAQSGVRLTLDQGPGAPAPGGLSLRPRPDAPCSVSIAQAR